MRAPTATRGPATGEAFARTVRRLSALLACTLSTWAGPAVAAADAGSAWVRIELVENTLEGPAFDRCEVEGTVKDGEARRWRLFYGEARAGTSAAWEAMRARSGCAAVASERAPNPWSLRGSPYLLVDAELRPTFTSEREVRLEVALTVQRLTGFEKGGAPTYERRPEARTLRVRAGGSAVVPLLVASPGESGAFGVRELLLRVRAAAPASGARTEYGEIAVSADVPRAQILLDGGFIGHTSATGPVVLGAVRTGDRVVAVRDASGREARTVARVEKGRRATVSLTLLPKATTAAPGALLPLGRNAQGGEEFWRAKDAAIVVRVPGGEFLMGSAEGEGEPAERPRHTVRVGGFLMDKTEVSWGQYLLFAKQTGRPLPTAPVWGTPEVFPASFVTWDDARAFCAWAGGRLPTEAEWERAARGGDGRRFPWGTDWDPSRCNTQDGGPHGPTAVASYPECASAEGVLDLAGSMWEWCADWFDADYYHRSPVDSPAGPETGRTRASRGGCWTTDSSWVRSANRQGIDPAWPDPSRGFRCVQDDRDGAGR